jgi:hypothetical protein
MITYTTNAPASNGSLSNSGTASVRSIPTKTPTQTPVSNNPSTVHGVNLFQNPGGFPTGLNPPPEFTPEPALETSSGMAGTIFARPQPFSITKSALMHNYLHIND